jgi:hypothetical protein
LTVSVADFRNDQHPSRQHIELPWNPSRII